MPKLARYALDDRCCAGSVGWCLPKLLRLPLRLPNDVGSILAMRTVAILHQSEVRVELAGI